MSTLAQIPKVLHEKSTNTRVVLTHHARQRIAEMDADLLDVARVAITPHSWYLGSDRSGRTRVNRRDDSDIAVVLNPTEMVVISVLWATTEEYER